MEIFHSWEASAEKGRRAAVTVGNFDGMHLAHQELLRRVRQRAKERNAASVAITFDPHPAQVLAPQKAPRLLTPLPVKLELLGKSGIDRLLVLPFTEEFSRWSPERFVEEVLVKALHSESVWVGENFRFGHRQAGTPETLKGMGLRWNFQTEVLPQVRFRTTTVSSSQIRCLLQNGNLSMTNRLLGRAFSIRSSVQAGLGIGRNQTVPTLNLAPYDGILPAVGVYVTRARLAEPDGAGRETTALRSVTNVGYRPTFGERELGVETHLLEPWQGAPPTSLEVSFLYRLREERKFASAEELKSQIQRDIQRAQGYFRRLEHFRVAPVPPD